MSYRYYRGAHGRRYCYSSTAEHRCRYGNRAGVGELPEELSAIAADLGSVGLDLRRVLRIAHIRTHSVESEERRGRCAACGARLEKLGYRAWIEVPIDDVAAESLDENEQRNHARHQLLGATHWQLSASVRRFGLKREAIEWAREEAEFDRSC